MKISEPVIIGANLSPSPIVHGWRQDLDRASKKLGRPSWALPGIAGWAPGVRSVDTQNTVTIKGSNKGESYERGAGKKKQENLFDLCEVLGVFLIKFKTGGI